MKRLILITGLITLAFAVILAVVMSLTVSTFETKYTEVEKRYKEEVGSTVIYNKDTLTVTDYSVMDDTFTLSNGSKVNVEFVFQQNKK